MRLRRAVRGVVLVASLLTFLVLAGAVGAQNMARAQMLPANDSGQSGSAEITDMGDGMVRVIVTIEGQPAGVAQPIHFHEGSCENLNPAPKYPLANLVNGRSDTMVRVPLSELLSRPYAINSHKSAAEVDVFVTCGNVTTATTAAPAPDPNALAPVEPPQTGAGGLAVQAFSFPLPLVSAILLVLGLAVGAFSLRRRAA